MPTGFKVDCVSSWSWLYVGEATSRGGQREGGGGGTQSASSLRCRTRGGTWRGTWGDHILGGDWKTH